MTQLPSSRESNDYIFAAMKRNPKRLGGFAALPMADPKEAVKELERRVREQGFQGAIINGHCQGRYLDDQFFWPVLECACSRTASGAFRRESIPGAAPCDAT